MTGLMHNFFLTLNELRDLDACLANFLTETRPLGDVNADCGGGGGGGDDDDTDETVDVDCLEPIVDI